MKKAIIIIVAVLLVISGFLYFKGKKKKVNQMEINPEIGTIAVEFRLDASVEPRNRLEIKPQVSGRIEDVLVVEGQRVKKGEIIAWMSSTDRAALLDLARAKGEDEVKKWEDTYKPTPIIAPIDGFIILRNKEPGQTVSMSDVILVMADELIISANVDETDLKNIYLGQNVAISLDAYPDKNFTGKVEHIAYESTVVSNVTSYEVKIRPVRPPANFRAGMSATIQVIAQKKNDVLLLPIDAVIDKRGKKFVKVKTENKKDGELKEVETGINNGKQIEIISGIEESDTILLPQTESKGGSNTRRTGGMPGMPH
ncbi:MAG: efflux RND transporter periplasmic adaptor subunit [Elusimicrobia bacterium]|nr:efflux RND transporter periplasmic adaptor subunit [Elusimicrobiota bacterium]MBU2614593.1 efflux RND transporter periplasmic adaptor subunit [Elusimicrobiota bacterium]